MITTAGVYLRNFVIKKIVSNMSSEDNKRAWIDFGNFPHVLFFNQIMKELYKKS